MSNKIFKQKKSIKTIGLALTLIFAVSVFAVSRRTSSSSSAVPAASDARGLTQTQPKPDIALAINRAQLDRHIVRALDALGDRFESAEKGRCIATGTLTRSVAGQESTSQVVITRETSDKLVIQETSITGSRTLGHDGSRSWASGQPITSEERVLIETLVRDSVDHLISGQAAGAATLHLGDMFRSDDGTNSDYTGPYFDIIRVDDQFVNQDGARTRPTLYYFNSRSGLPAKIVYEDRDQGMRTEVEFDEWTNIAEQKFPVRTTWKDRGKLKQQLVITQVQFVATTNDGIFNASAVR